MMKCKIQMDVINQGLHKIFSNLQTKEVPLWMMSAKYK